MGEIKVLEQVNTAGPNKCLFNHTTSEQINLVRWSTIILGQLHFFRLFLRRKT
jgi:hypothetical protein